MINSEAVTVFHTGDWKIDYNPQIGEGVNEKRLKQLSNENILAMVCDSTNVLVEGSSGSEEDVIKPLTNIIKSCKERVIVSTFASNVTRVNTLAKIGVSLGRKVGLVGQSMWRMVEIAKTCGYLTDLPAFISEKDIKNIDKDNFPCHIDNSASNFMISDKNDLKIIDLDFCSNDDPLSDLGSFASEVCLFKNEINPIIEEYFGVFKQNLANRCFIYSTLDDLKWGLYSFIFSKISERNHIEFMKYANWRFLSCNQKLLNYDLGEIIENI